MTCQSLAEYEANLVAMIIYARENCPCGITHSSHK